MKWMRLAAWRGLSLTLTMLCAGLVACGGGGDSGASSPAPTASSPDAAASEPADYTAYSFRGCPSYAESTGWESLQCAVGTLKGQLIDGDGSAGGACTVHIQADGLVRFETDAGTWTHQIPSQVEVAEGKGRAWYRPVFLSKTGPHAYFESIRTATDAVDSTFTMEVRTQSDGSVSTLRATHSGGASSCFASVNLPANTSARLKTCPVTTLVPYDPKPLECLVGQYNGFTLDSSGAPTSAHCALTLYADGNFAISTDDAFEAIQESLYLPLTDLYQIDSSYARPGTASGSMLEVVSQYHTGVADHLELSAREEAAGVVVQWHRTAKDGAYKPSGVDADLRCATPPLP